MTTSILYDPQILSSLSETDCIFLDTNIIITAQQSSEMLKVLNALKDHGCALITIQPVLIEYLRGANDVEAYNTLLDFFQSLVVLWPIDKQILLLEEALIIFKKTLQANVHYTDFLLALCLYKFQNSYLLSGDHSAFNNHLFTRESFIAVDIERNIKTYGLYKLSMISFNKAARNILQSL